MNLRLFRDAAATSLVLEDPAHVLGHATFGTSSTISPAARAR